MANAMRKMTLRGTKLSFYEKYEALIGGSWAQLLSHFEDSDQDEEDYSWLGPVPELEEWIGDRVVKGLLAIDYSIKNKKFQTAIKLMRDWFKRNKSSRINDKINGLARRAGAEHIEKLLSAAMIAAESTVCYDSQYFFDTDHVTPGAEYQTNQSNLVAKVLSNLPTSNHGTAATHPSPEDMAYLIADGIGLIQAFKDEFGAPANQGSKEFLVVCGTVGLWTPAVQAIQAANLNSGESNVLQGIKKHGIKVDVVLNSRLSSLTTKFDIYDVTPDAGKPYIVQEEEGAVVETLGEGSDYCFDHDAYKFGVKAKRNVGYGLWRKALRFSLSQS